jgi:UrcA family protein
MKETKMFKGLLATIVIVALGAPAYVTAADKSDLKGFTVKVSYADLNLEKYEGAKALYRRLQQASKQACGVRSFREEGSLRATSEGEKCYRNTLSEAVAEIDNDLVTQIHNS